MFGTVPFTSLWQPALGRSVTTCPLGLTYAKFTTGFNRDQDRKSQSRLHKIQITRRPSVLQRNTNLFISQLNCRRPAFGLLLLQ